MSKKEILYLEMPITSYFKQMHSPNAGIVCKSYVVGQAYLI